MMDYEKAYKAVLQTATQWIKDGCTGKERICLECVFPELRESEDERIRKKIIDIVKAAPFDEGKDVLLAYLEKQKEQKPVDLPPGFYLITPDGKKYYSKEFRIGDMKMRLVENEKKEDLPKWSEEDDQLIGFIFDLLNDLFWREDWAMSKEECLERLQSLRPPKDCSDCSKHLQGYIDGRGDAEKKLLDEYGILIMPEGELHMKARWKPSEEQMEALRKAVNKFANTDVADSVRLSIMYDNLKKL